MFITSFLSNKEALNKMPMPIPVIESFVASPLYLNTPSSERILDVSGQQCRKNPDKSIWSYNPEDTSLNVTFIDTFF